METVTSRDGTAIVFDRTGTGPPVVLVCGAISDRASHDDLAELLAPHFTVINYDRRCRGDSGDNGSLDDSPDVARQLELDDLTAVIAAAADGAPVHLFGASSGAGFALEAVLSGIPALSLALWEPPLGFAEEHRTNHLTCEAEVRRLVAEDRYDDALARFMSYVSVPDAEIEQMREQPWWPAMTRFAPSLRYDFSGMRDGMLHAERLASMTTPAIVMEGENSMEFLSKAAQGVLAALPDKRHALLKGQNHDAAADALAPVLIEFFTAQS